MKDDDKWNGVAFLIIVLISILVYVTQHNYT